MEDEIKIFPVSPNDCITHWQKVEPLIESALPLMMGRYLPIDVLALLIGQAQDYQAWFIIDDKDLLGLIITQVVQYPRARGLNMFLIAAKDGKGMERWYSQAELIMGKYARARGASFYEVSGRRGWAKVFGLEPRAVYFVRNIDDEA